MDPETITEEQWESIRGELVEAALSDRPPVDVAIQRLSLVFDRDPAGQIERLEDRIGRMLAEQGVVECRRVDSLVAGFDQPVSKTIYYRPSEQLLLDAVEDSHPIVLATTVESQRYIEALVKHCSRSEEPCQLWIWRGAAGRDLIERLDTLQRGPEGVRVAQTSALKRQGGSALAELAKQEFDGNGGRKGSICVDEIDLSYWWIPSEKDPGLIDVLIDDAEVAGEVHFEEQLGVSVFEAASERPDLFPARAESRQTDGFVSALVSATKFPSGSVLVIPDAHHFLSHEPNTPRGEHSLLNIGALKDTYHRIMAGNRPVKVVLLCGDVTLPKDLREEVMRVDLPLPGRRELFVAIRDQLGRGTADEHCVRLANEAAGMTIAEVKAVLARENPGQDADHAQHRLEALRKAKRRHIARSPALELFEDSVTTELGGMERFDRWLSVRKMAFSEPELASRFGINRSPRGVLLLGIPGSGKSLAAKAIARDWGLPLVRLDMGALQNVWVGSSEARVREALRVIEAMAPCVMWIDEIDKGISQGEGSHAHSADLNIRATLLTWMQENRRPVFIVATANKFASLPPELTRAGRFDARFFFGCPGASGRERIIQIHLRARGYDPHAFDLASLVVATHGFTGAEIEQVILDSLYAAFGAQEKLSQEMLEGRAREMQPLIRSAGKQLDELWALIEDGRVELASDDMLGRAQVARLIDPHLYRPIYCQLARIEGFERHCVNAERFCMASPYGGPAAVVMATGEHDWIYVQTNFRRRPDDIGNFKFVDQFAILEQNLVFDALVVDHALETIYFETDELRARFRESPMLSAYSELFATV